MRGPVVIRLAVGFKSRKKGLALGLDRVRISLERPTFSFLLLFRSLLTRLYLQYLRNYSDSGPVFLPPLSFSLLVSSDSFDTFSFFLFFQALYVVSTWKLWFRSLPPSLPSSVFVFKTHRPINLTQQPSNAIIRHLRERYDKCAERKKSGCR